MRKQIFLALALLLTVTMQAQAYWNGTSNKTFSGSGTQADPYLIGTAEQLAGLAERTNVDKEDFAGQYIKLTSDIYLTDFSNPDTTAWLQWEPIAHILVSWTDRDTALFRGHFDGDGHTIYNMYYGAGMNWASDWDPNDFDIDPSAYDYSVMNKALFVNVEGATIENVRMANARMAAVNQAFLVQQAGAGTVIRNCHVQGEMRGTQAGISGLVDTNYGLIEDCSVDIHSDLQGGGAFVGRNEASGVIRNCTSTGSMRCTMSDGAGFVSVNLGLIEKCTANVLVQALLGPSPVAGNPQYFRSGSGFVNTNQGGTIRECAAFGDVLGEGLSANYIWTSGISGFCHRNWESGRIESCYCTGALRDVSDSTGRGGNPAFASFCFDNGYDAMHYNDGMDRGDIFNCYSTSTIRHHDANYYSNDIHAFLSTSHTASGGFEAWLVEPSQQIGCYFNQEGLPAISDPSLATWDGIGKTMAQMQSQAFVDTLNMIASMMGLSQWELRDGLPRPTGVYTPAYTSIFGGGDGSKTNPYLISTKQHLINLAALISQGMSFNGCYFLQTADIALNAPMAEWEEVAPTRWKPIASPRTNPWYSRLVANEFKGVYDGGFHEIKNMYINNTLDKQGLFYRLGKGAEVRNLGVTDVYIRASSIGILAGEITDQPRVIQCWTSGDAATQGQNVGDLAGMVADMAGGSYVLNCSSSARLTGSYSPGLGIYVDPVYGGYHLGYVDRDTLVNFLYTGHMNAGQYTNSVLHRENYFADREIAQVETLGDGTTKTAASTEWMQSKTLVNIYNYSVTRWNERHAGNETLQLHYWQWQEGGYPRIAQDPSWRPPVTISFISNGGTAVTTKYVYPESEVLPPQRPLRKGYLFAGWYKDEALTQIYDWKNEHPTSNITLYARWHEDKRFEMDFTPFQSEFAKTYHIKTAAQLRGFAALQNGLYTWDDSVSCYDSYGTYAADNVTQTQVPWSFKGKKVVLDNDIVLCDTADWQYWGRGAFGVPFMPIGWYYGIHDEGNHQFTGTFDGQGHTVYGMYMEKNGLPGWENNAGLFALVGDSAVIRNVGIAASVIDGQDYNTLGQYTDAVRYWKRCGFGEQGWRAVGLLFGSTNMATIEQCYAEGNIYCTYANAFIGQISNYYTTQIDTVTNCYSRVNVYDNDGEPEGVFATSDYSAEFINCYSAGVTKGAISECTHSGYGTITQNSTYHNKERITYRSGCDHSKACTTNEMHAKANYQNWDFDSIWGRNDAINDGYPYLRVFHEGAPEDSEDPVVVTGITLNMTTASLITGDSLQLIATVLPENAENKKVIWTADTWGVSYPVEYAWFDGVDENGMVRTKVDLHCGSERSGNIRVVATTEEGEYTATCVLNIKQPGLNLKTLAYRRVGETEWTWGSTNYIENFEYMIAAYASPDEAKQAVTWSLDDETNLSLTETTDTVYSISGKAYHCSRAIVRVLHATNESTYVHAQLPNGISNSLRMYTQLIVLNSLWICKAPASDHRSPDTNMAVGSQQQLDFVPYGIIGTDIYNLYQTISYMPEFEWSSSNPAVLTVDQNGLLTAVGAGTATITLTAIGTDISYTTAEITVAIVEPTSITINEGSWWTTIDMVEGDTLRLTATVSPVNATDKTVTWSSGNPSVATVDQTGLVTAVAYSNDEVRITATTVNGKSAYTNVRVARGTQPVYYTIRFLNFNGVELQSSQVLEGDMPAYTGTTPTKPEDDNYTYTFRGWSPAIIAATADADYTAQFTATAKEVTPSNGIQVRLDPQSANTWNTVYLYAWTDNGQPCGAWPGTAVSMDTDGWWTYTFAESISSVNIIWNNGSGDQTRDINSVTASTCYALLSQSGNNIRENVVDCPTPSVPEPVYYTIRFLNYNRVELQNTQVLEGDMPVYTGVTPTKPEDDGFTYTFSGWSPAVVAATANADYIAQFTATPKPKPVYYTVTFLDWDGFELFVEEVEEGHDAVGPEREPTREGYIFIGWSKPITNITANLIVVAQYELIPLPVYYTIRFLNYDRTLLQSSQVLEGDMPVYAGDTPTREEDDDYTYAFSGWYPEIVVATANTEYIAQFTAIEKSHEGIEDIPASDSSAPRKILIDNVIYILRGDKIYTVQGQEVK